MARRLAVGGFSVAALVSCLLVLRSRPDDQLADLKVYWGAARWVSHGLPLYEFHAENGDPFTYPPFAELVLAPLARVPFSVAGALWTGISLWAIVVLGWLVASRALHTPIPKRPAVAWLIALAVLISAPGQSNIHFGQISLFVVLACLADGLQITGPRWHGVLIGLAAAVKLTPLLFIVYLVMSGQWRTAARAVAAFTLATGLAWLVHPADSWQFWTSAMFATDRIGDITALGNQSVNGMLLRAGLPAPAHSILWFLLASALVGSALWRARRLHQAGLGERAIVLVGCATIAASPVSWTHHQFWTVLAGILLLATTGRAQRVAGGVLLVVMTVNLGTLVAAAGAPTPGAGYLADNLRALAVGIVSTTALLTATEAGRTRPLVPRAVARTPLVGRRAGAALAAAFCVFLVLPVPTRGSAQVAPAAPGVAAAHSLTQEPTCDPSTQCRASGPLYPVNYSAGWSDNGVTVLGLADAAVSRIDYVPAPGRNPVTLHLDPTNLGDQAFEFTAGDTTYAQLIVYGPDHQPLGDYGAKLRNG